VIPRRRGSLEAVRNARARARASERERERERETRAKFNFIAGNDTQKKHKTRVSPFLCEKRSGDGQFQAFQVKRKR